MPLAFLLDEHLRGDLWDLIMAHNRSGGLPIDAERVGDPPDLPLGTLDPALLILGRRKRADCPLARLPHDARAFQ